MNHPITTWFRRVRITGRQARSSSNPGCHHRARAFTLVEMLVAMTVLSVLVLMIGSLFHQAHRGWISAQNRTECYAEGRKILDAITSDLHQAVAGGGITFEGAPNKLSMVASVNRSSYESADLTEVGYEYDAAARMLKRNYTGPIGAQPSGASGTKPPTFTAFSVNSSVAISPVQVGPYVSMGVQFMLNQDIYLTEVGVVDSNFDGQLALSESAGANQWEMVLMQKNAGVFTLFNKWLMAKSSMVPSSPPGFMFFTVSNTGILLPAG
jgi:prepilin-type N-terminal cleavage/methylation domain-containing protein